MVKLPVLLMQLLIFLFLSYIGIIYPLKYDKQYLLSEPFSEYVAVNFGLAVGGVIDISYNVNTSYNDSVSNSYVLLLVINEKQKNNWYGNIGSTSNSNNDQTQIQNKIYNLCTQPSTLRRQLFNSGNFFLEINEELGSDRYSVALLQCKLGNRASPVAATINAELKNPRPKSDGYSQLPIEEVILPRVLGGELILYALLILGSIGQIYYAG